MVGVRCQQDLYHVDDRRWLKEEFQCHDLICGWSVFVGKTSKKKEELTIC